MKNENQDARVSAAGLVSFLRRLQGDRGAMADLRRGLSPATRHRAWPWLGQIGGIGDPRSETVAGLYAYHPVHDPAAGNLGQTARKISGTHNSYEGRFRRIMACDRNDICSYIRPIVFAAAARGIGVDYQRLFTDLYYWGDAVKAQWAQAFWGEVSGIPDVPAPESST